jgi:hypothetical protein
VDPRPSQSDGPQHTPAQKLNRILRPDPLIQPRR